MYKRHIASDSNALLLKEPGRSFTSVQQKKKFKNHQPMFPHDQPGSQPKLLNLVEQPFLFVPQTSLLSIKCEFSMSAASEEVVSKI